MPAWSASTYLREFNIGIQESRILIILARLGEVTVNQICEFGKMDKGNVSRAVKKLVREGRIKEKLDLKDKRSIRCSRE
jgi:DNA-binding MarR family transcriptional regulator